MASFSCCYCCCCSQFYKTMVNVVLRILDILISWHKVWDLSFLNLPVFQVFSWTPCHLNPSIFKQASGLVLSSDHKCQTDFAFEIFVSVQYFYLKKWSSLGHCIEAKYTKYTKYMKASLTSLTFHLKFSVSQLQLANDTWRSLEANIFSSSSQLHWSFTFTITKYSKLIFASEVEHMTPKIEWHKSPSQKWITISFPTMSRAYLIIVTGATGAARVNFFCPV